MGVIRKGANGGFKGKAGSVIGSSWKGIDYIKGLYKKRTKPATEEQLMQQTKFTLLMRFLLPLKVFIRIGYGQRKTDTHTPMNVAFQDNIDRVITGDYPDYALDYSQVRIAEGYSAGGSESIAVDEGVLTVAWDTLLNEMYEQRDDDRVYVVLYHPGIDQFLTAPTPPQRADGTVDITLPNHFRTGQGHVWLFTADRKRLNVSRSVYLGEVALA
ncbi:DUF6266 family protein [Parapedobacter koreensis]|uniref:Uncharacterized protein n=1 Tax=Parapedobacter koreensis TaxID=332977 RepID=A0A1H7TVF7_9SPHI|nr:DUF6266 family protein [Parapedobacter koreensis]SEL88832.1 hypothetical protein SAMN05421740_112118 [Parapedobacter koreensis]